MRCTTAESLELSRRYLDLIGGRPMSLAEKQEFIAETIEAYEKHVNRGFISYRKSVTEAGEFAALEWSGQGAMLRDLLGREYIDCLGGYGIFSAGINHPRIVKAVQDQMGRMALNSQELLEPWRAGLARLLAAITPGSSAAAFSSTTAPMPSKGPSNSRASIPNAIRFSRRSGASTASRSGPSR